MRKIIYILFLFFIGCSTESTPSYVLNVNVQPPEAGSVSPTTGEYDEGEEVNVSATPNEHWVFDRWQGGATGSQNPTPIVMNNDMNVTAVFVKKEYPLSINITGQGAVNESIVQAKDYEHGTIVELEAVPNEGWNFINWKNDLSGNENPAQITVDGEKTVEALFEIQTFSLSVEIDGEGSIDISPDKEQYEYNEQIELTANPATGWQFSIWEGDGTSNNNPLSVVVKSSLSIKAIFEKQCTNPEECVGVNFYASSIVGKYVFDSTLNVINDLSEPILLTEIYVRGRDGEIVAVNNAVEEWVDPDREINFSIDYLPQPTIEQFLDFDAELFFKYKGDTYKITESGSVSTFKGKENILRIPLTK